MPNIEVEQTGKQQLGLVEALAKYHRNSGEEAVALSEQERKKVLDRFPISGWPELPIERYALGQGEKEDRFCWWMEFGTNHIGSIAGGSAVKHMIYKQKSGEWSFDRNQFKHVDEAWQAVRAGFVERFQHAQNGDWSTISEDDGITGGQVLKTKALVSYFPDQLLPICSVEHLKHFLQLVGIQADSLKGNNAVRFNRLLLETLQGMPEFAGWKPKELEQFLYFWADPRDQRMVVKIAPGSNASLWNECLEGGYMRVGWGRAGDLTEFETKEAFRPKFLQEYGPLYNNNLSTVTKKGNELWTLRELKPGDLIVANQGTSKILGVGEVLESGYKWTEHGDDDFNHIVHVKWDTSYAKEIPPQKGWAMATIAPIPQTLLGKIMTSNDKPLEAGATPKVRAVDPIFRELDSALARKGQAILYGPPGTGKTYIARRFAVWWSLKQAGFATPDAVIADKNSFEETEDRLSTSKVSRNIWWVVANPKNWSWDRLPKEKVVDFQLGRIQKNYPNVRKGDLVVGYQSTPDSRIVALATVTKELHVNGDDERVIQLAPLCEIENGPTWDQLKEDPVLKDSEPIRHQCRGTLFAVSEEEFDQISDLLTEMKPDLKRFLYSTDEVGPLTRMTFHPSYSYEDFIEGFRPMDTKSGNLVLRLEDGIFKRVCRAAQANPQKPYLVMIDEINRANVAKVFGEIITLLEKDKRGMRVSLPQSKESFSIPNNVFVLGTMNTADRSIKLLDSAMRRRFAFIELMPNSNLLQGGKVGNLSVDEFLDALNRRIAAKEGREKQIGHSFFMDENGAISDMDEFTRRFRQEVLPLLQEYCYEDYGLLAGYIGDKLVDKEGQMLNDEVLNDPASLVAALEKEFEKDAVNE